MTEKKITIKYPATREEAKELKVRFFYPDKPCKYGHKGLWYAASGSCVECRKIKDREKRIERAKAREIEKATPKFGVVDNGKVHRIMTRQEARELGYEFYFTGECRNGHKELRNTKYGYCLACNRDRSRAFLKTYKFLKEHHEQCEHIEKGVN